MRTCSYCETVKGTPCGRYTRCKRPDFKSTGWSHLAFAILRDFYFTHLFLPIVFEMIRAHAATYCVVSGEPSTFPTVHWFYTPDDRSMLQSGQMREPSSKMYSTVDDLETFLDMKRNELLTDKSNARPCRGVFSSLSATGAERPYRPSGGRPTRTSEIGHRYRSLMTHIIEFY